MDHLLAAASFVEQIDLLKTNKEEWPGSITDGSSQQSEPSHEEVARVVTEAIVKEALRCAESPLISQSVGTSCPPNIGLSCRRNILAVEEGHVDPRYLLLNDNMTTARRSSARLASRAASPADDLTNSTLPSYQQTSSGSTRKRKLAPAAPDSSRSKKISKSGSKHQRVKPQLGGDSSRPGLIVLKIQQWSNAPRSNAADQNAEDVEDFAPIKPRPLASICSATPSRPIDVTPYSTPQQAIEVPHFNLESLSASRSRLQAMVQPHILDGMRYLAAHQPEKPLKWLSDFCRIKSEVVEGHWPSDEAYSALVSMDANIVIMNWRKSQEAADLPTHQATAARILIPQATA